MNPRPHPDTSAHRSSGASAEARGFAAAVADAAAVVHEYFMMIYIQVIFHSSRLTEVDIHAHGCALILRVRIEGGTARAECFVHTMAILIVRGFRQVTAL